MSEAARAYSKIGILAGKGNLPVEIVEACEKEKIPYCIVSFEGETPVSLIEGREYFSTRIGAVGAIIEGLRSRGADAMVMAGRLERPKLTALRPDATGARLLARLGASLFGDDRVLRTIAAFFEEEGFTILGADDLIDRVKVTAGPLGAHHPTRRDLDDISRAYEIIRAIGKFDIGQGAIVQNGHVLGVEAIEGTDAMIERCGVLRFDSPGGVLVKARKPQQDRRADLPAIGPETVTQMAAAGFAGIAVEAGASLLLQRSETIAAADAAGLFLYGIDPVAFA